MDIKFKKSDIINKNYSIFIATFSRYEKGKRLPTNGMVEPMLSFFLPRVNKILLLDQPHPGSDKIHPIIEQYQQRKLKNRFIIPAFFYFPIYILCRLQNTNRTHISFKIRDLFSVVFIGITQKERYNLFIGLESINTFAGIFLRKLGKVNSVVYYVSDYSPVRFKNNFFNFLYIWLDRFCITYADYTWDVSPAIQKARIKAGLNSKKKYSVIHVPNALFSSQIGSLPIFKRYPDSLVYMGTLDVENGVDIAIAALKEVRKRVPNVTLRIIGGGEYDISRLKELVKNLRLENCVTFYGFILNNDEMAKIVKTSYIGLAPYRAFPDSLRWYGDASKIRQYLASGLPVVTTQVPPFGQYIVKQGAGITTKDTIKSFSDGIIKLLSDDGLYRKLSVAAEEISKDNTWENVYTKALDDMKTIGNSRV